MILTFVLLEPLWVNSIISGRDVRVVSVRTLFLAGMIHTCRAAPCLAIPLIDTNVWTTRVAQYIISIFSSIMTT